MELLVLFFGVVSLVIVIVTLANIGTIAAETKKIRAILDRHDIAAVQRGEVMPPTKSNYNPPRPIPGQQPPNA